ncbi:MAG: 2Fe-2S iron-sulfur cluster-binding protein [Pseudomonadota bacterium]
MQLITLNGQKIIMPAITFIESDSTQHQVEIDVGRTLMEGATMAGIDGIVAECGGSCACATCHCYIDSEWVEAVGQVDAIEEAMLEAAVDPRPNSRLSCQVKVTESMAGLIVHVPESQF